MSCAHLARVLFQSRTAGTERRYAAHAGYDRRLAEQGRWRIARTAGKRHGRRISAFAKLVSGADAEQERVFGLSAGAVDFVSKPFSGAELAARIQVQLLLMRRTAAPALAGRSDDASTCRASP